MAHISFVLTDLYPILEQTPKTLDSMLRQLPENWIHAKNEEHTWSAFDIVGHYIHGERTDWVPRLELMLSDRESKTFEPFDRFAQFTVSEGKTILELLDTFKKLRTENIARLKNHELSDQDLKRTGVHPEFGTVTVQQLLSAWAVHDYAHLNQLSRVLAAQYRENVGQWKAYLSILNP